ETAPQRPSRQSLVTERIASQRITLGLRSPPSGGVTGTWAGTPRKVDVSGRTITSPAGPALKGSTDRTRTGRRPDCSWPRVAPRSASQTSPRQGSAIALPPRWQQVPVLPPAFRRVEPVHERARHRAPLSFDFGPRLGVRPQGGVAGVHGLEEHLAAVVLHRL